MKFTWSIVGKTSDELKTKPLKNGDHIYLYVDIEYLNESIYLPIFQFYQIHFEYFNNS